MEEMIAEQQSGRNSMNCGVKVCELKNQTWNCEIENC